MGAQSFLRNTLVFHLRTAVLDLQRFPARRSRIAISAVRAGKDRQRLRVRTDREGSMCVTRVEFQYETEWYALLEIVDGELRIRSGYGGGFLRRAGSGGVASWLARFSEKVKTAGFRKWLLREARGEGQEALGALKED